MCASMSVLASKYGWEDTPKGELTLMIKLHQGSLAIYELRCQCRSASLFSL